MSLKSVIFSSSLPIVNYPNRISEFGADALAGFRGTEDDQFTEEYQRRVYGEQVEAIAQIPIIRGTSPWILYDFRSPRRLNPYQNHYNLKGLVSKDKKQGKLAFDVMQDFYGKIC